LTIWRLDCGPLRDGETSRRLDSFDVTPPAALQGLDFLSVEFTYYLPAPANTYYVVIGTSDGSLVAYDLQRNEYVDIGTSGEIIDGAIGAISVKSGSIVIASSRGVISQYPLVGTQIQPEDIDMVTEINCDAAIVAISMDDQNNEGLIGTENGTIYYVNFGDRADLSIYPIPIVSSNNINRDRISLVKIDPGNP